MGNAKVRFKLFVVALALTAVPLGYGIGADNRAFAQEQVA